MRNPLLRVHLEHCSAKPPVFCLSPELIEATRRSNKDLGRSVRFSIGQDLVDLDMHLQSADVLVTSSDVVRDPRFPRARLAQAAPGLRMLHLIGAGVEGLVPLDWLPSSIKLTNNSGVHAGKAREFLLMALLALNARLPALAWNQRHAQWDQLFTPLIAGKTLAVIGLGNLGRAAIAAGRLLGLKIVGVRRTGTKVPGVDRVYRPAQIRAALANADFIVVAAPMTTQTRNLLDREVLASTKAGVGIVNMGRAGVVDYAALAALLTQGHVSGAILDVFSPEPLAPDAELWSTRNLIISPHVSSDDRDGYMTGTMNLVCENLRRLIARRPLKNVVDTRLEY
jgi:phosphoglycerate dehydrogenase-like enzyme